MPLTDVDECADEPNLCGDFGGSCVNIADGGFYSCDCDPGYAGEGDASTLGLRCIGMLHHVKHTRRTKHDHDSIANIPSCWKNHCDSIIAMTTSCSHSFRGL